MQGSAKLAGMAHAAQMVNKNSSLLNAAFMKQFENAWQALWIG
jgi:hypothetical protein